MKWLHRYLRELWNLTFNRLAPYQRFIGLIIIAATLAGATWLNLYLGLTLLGLLLFLFFFVAPACIWHQLDEKLQRVQGELNKQNEMAKREHDVLTSMPQLMTEMRSDLLKPESRFIREFFVLPNRRVSLGGSTKPRFVYYEEDHENLRGQIDVLETHGFLQNVTPMGNKALIYSMTEKLVNRLCNET